MELLTLVAAILIVVMYLIGYSVGQSDQRKLSFDPQIDTYWTVVTAIGNSPATHANGHFPSQRIANLAIRTIEPEQGVRVRAIQVAPWGMPATVPHEHIVQDRK